MSFIRDQQMKISFLLLCIVSEVFWRPYHYVLLNRLSLIRSERMLKTKYNLHCRELSPRR